MSSSVPPFGRRPRVDVIRETPTLGNRRVVSLSPKFERHGVFVGCLSYLRDFYRKRKQSSVRRKPGEKDAWQMIMDKIEPSVDRDSDGNTLLYQVRYDVSLNPNATHMNPRGGLVFGCENTVLMYVAHCIVSVYVMENDPSISRLVYNDVSFDARLEGVYAVTSTPINSQPLYIIPYFDIDVKVPCGVVLDTVLKNIYIDYLCELESVMDDLIEQYVLVGDQHRARKHQWFFCLRESKGQMKLSLHVHWYNLVVDDMSVMSNIAVNHMKSVGYPVYDPDTECFVDGVEERGNQRQDTLVDQGVYSSTTQLFRFPFTGKMRQSADAQLLPIEFEMKEDDVFLCKDEDRSVPAVYEYLRRANISTRHKSEYVHLPVPVRDLTGDLVDIGGSQLQVVGGRDRALNHNLIPEDDAARVLEFWLPILQHKVIPDFIGLRRSEAERMGVRTVVIPDEFDVSGMYQTGLDDLPGCWTLEVSDTFCLYDTRPSTPHRHPLKDGTPHCVTYVVDILRLRIAQACRRSSCMSRRKLQWYSFVHPTSHMFRVDKAPFRVADLQFFEPTGDVELRYDVGCQICIWHNIDYVCYDDLTNSFYVYLYDGSDDSMPRIWSESSVLVQDRIKLMVHELNEKYLSYMSVFINVAVEEQIRKYRQRNPTVTDDEIEDRRRDEHVKAVRVFKKRSQLILSVKKDKVKDSMILLVSNKLAMKKTNIFDGMEVYPHLVPMDNHRCYNIFTGEQQKIIPDHRFTSYINAHFDLQDEHINDYDTWQLEMCSEDENYARYKKCITGITLSGKFERRVYVAIGQGRNGKSVEQSLLSELLNYRGFRRGINLNKNYLTSSGQSNSAANSPDPTALAIKYRVCMSIDELSERKLDGALVKTMCSGGRLSGRALYGKEEQEIDVRSSMWMICNEVPQVDYTQTAIVDRMVFIPYRTRWLNEQEYSLEMKSAGDRRFLKKADESFQQFVRDNFRNASFTSCMATLTAHFKQTGHREDVSCLADIKKPSVVEQQCIDYQYLHHPLKEFFDRWLVRKPSAWLVTDCVTLSTAFSAYTIFCQQNNKKWVRQFKVDSTKFEDMLGDVKATRRLYDDVIYVHPFVLHPNRIECVQHIANLVSEPPTSKRLCIERVSADADVL